MEDNGRYIYCLPHGSGRVNMKHEEKLGKMRVQIADCFPSICEAYMIKGFCLSNKLIIRAISFYIQI